MEGNNYVQRKNGYDGRHIKGDGKQVKQGKSLKSGDCTSTKQITHAMGPKERNNKSMQSRKEKQRSLNKRKN